MRNITPPPAQYRFKPGQSGNPAGRKKGEKTLTKALKTLLETKHVVADGVKMTGAMLVAVKLFENAGKNGDLGSIREIFDRVEGKVVQKIEDVTNPLEAYSDEALEALEAQLMAQEEAIAAADTDTGAATGAVAAGEGATAEV